MEHCFGIRGHLDGATRRGTATSWPPRRTWANCAVTWFANIASSSSMKAPSRWKSSASIQAAAAWWRTYRRRRYQPGEKGVLTVKVKPSSQPQGPIPGSPRSAIAAASVEDTAQVQIQATIRHEVAVTPGVLAWCGAGGFQAEVTVTDVRGQPLTVKAVQFTSPIVRAAVTGSEKGVTRILLQANGSIPAGRHDETLNIYTDDPLYQHFQVPVTLTGQARQAIAVTPERISLRLAAGEPVPSTLVRLRPSARDPWQSQTSPPTIPPSPAPGRWAL